MRRSVRLFSALTTVFVVLVVAVVLLTAPLAMSAKPSASPTPTASVTAAAKPSPSPSPTVTPPPPLPHQNAPWFPPALYSGGNATFSGTAKITGPLDDLGKPSSALYVGGTILNSSSGNLSTIWQYLASRRDVLPPMSVMMTDQLISELTQDLPTAPSGSSTGSLTLTKGRTYGAPITVNGNLTISGSGTYKFDSVWVTGSVVISNSLANVTMAKLHVGGSLTVGGGQMVNLGPTYVGGATSLVGQRQWTIKTLVVAGNVTIAGTQSIGNASAPAVVLMTGSGKTLTYSGSGSFYGLLCNRYGNFVGSGTGKVVGSVLCATSCNLSNSFSIAYDRTVGSRMFGLLPPVTTARVNGQDPVAWYNARVSVELFTDYSGWAPVSTFYGVAAGTTAPTPQSRYEGEFHVPVIEVPYPDGTYTASYFSRDDVGNVGPIGSITFGIDAAAPTGTVQINGGDPWTKDKTVTLALTAADGSGSGVTQMQFKNESGDWSTPEPYAANKRWTLGDGDGAKTVSVRYTDAAGNVSDATIADSIGLDTAKPTGTVTIGNASDLWTTSGDVTLTLTKADGALGSGVAEVQYSNDGQTWGAPEGWTDSKAWTLSTGDGAKTVSVRYTDAAGNVSDATIADSIGLDTAKPTGTVTIGNASDLWTTSGDVTLTLTKADGALGSGVAEVQYSNDGQTWGAPEGWTDSKAWTLSTGDGAKTVSVRYTDAAGNVSEVFSDTIALDTIAPDTTITSGPADGAWINDKTPIFAFEGSNGAATFECKVDGGGWVRCASPFDPPTLTEGPHTVQFRAIDEAGNQDDSPASRSFTVDTIAPDTTIEAGSADGAWIGSAVPTYAFSGSDNGSLADLTYEYQVDTGDWTACTSPFQTPALQDGAHTVAFRAVDPAGNWDATPATRTVRVDTNKPAGTLTIAGDDWTRNVRVTLAVNADDGSGSGATLMRFSSDASNWSDIWQPYVETTTWDLTTGDGPKIVYAQFLDAAGNQSTDIISDTVSLDTTGPSGSVRINGGAEWTSSADVTLAVTGHDGRGCGVADMRFSNDSEGNWSGWEAYATFKDWQLSEASQGTQTVYVQFLDAAGNQSTAQITDTISMDALAPSITASPDRPPDSNGWYSADLHYSLQVGDASGGSGIRETWYSIDGAAQEGTSFTVSGDGTHHVGYWTIDNAGRRTDGGVVVKIDTTPPATTITQPQATDGSLTFTLGAKDVATDSSGVQETFYKVDNAQSEGTEFTVSGDGTHTIAYWSVDNAGNKETEKSISVKIDTTKPNVWLTARNGATSAYNKPVFDFGAADADGLAGDPRVDLARLDGSGNVLGSTMINATSGKPLPDDLDDGSYRLTIMAQDNAGNVGRSSCDFAVKVPDHPFYVQSDSPHQGYLVGLYADDTDATGNSNGSWDGKAWEWTISGVVSGEEVGPYTFEGPVRFVTLPDATGYHVRLTVTDTATGAQCVSTQTVEPAAQAPYVHALNIEVLENQSATLVARFLDPGWDESHTAAWTLDEQPDPTGAPVQEDRAPAMDCGYVSATSTPLDAGTYEGHLTVADSQVSTEVPFIITAIQPNMQRDEPNDTITSNTPVIDGGQVHLSYIQSANDIDIFEVRTPDDGPLPYGTEVLVTLRDLPADYDVAVIQDANLSSSASTGLDGSSCDTGSTSSWQDAGFNKGSTGFNKGSTGLNKGSTGFNKGSTTLDDLSWNKGSTGLNKGSTGFNKGSTPLMPSAYLASGLNKGSTGFNKGSTGFNKGSTYFENIGLNKGSTGFNKGSTGMNKGTTEFVRDPLLSTLFTLGADTNTLDGWSFADMSSTGLGDNTATGNEINFAELGFSAEAQSDRLITGFSAHVGTQPEVVLVKTDCVGGHMYIAVKGANGAYSNSQPYALQVETSLPLDIPDIVNTGSEPYPAVVDEDHQTADPRNPDPTPPAQPEPLTLFVTQAERINAMYGTTDNPDPFGTTILPVLHDACASDLVRGVVRSVPSTLFNTWDATPWETTLANDVTQGIRDEVQQYLAAHDTIKYVVIVGSDDVIPQRRVQDQTVIGNERGYADVSWLYNDSPQLASMYDGKVLTDDYYVDAQPTPYNGRELYVPDIAVSRLVETPSEIANTIQEFLRNDGRLAGGSSVVTGQDFMKDGAERVFDILQSADLGPKLEPVDTWKVSDVQTDLFDQQRNVADFNAHFLHYGGISAYGYNHLADDDFDWTTELLSGSKVSSQPNFRGKLVVSMGCHSGLNLPERDVALPRDFVGDPDPRLDVAQAIARQQGVLVGNTGYGFGDTEGIGGTEALLGDFVGQATTADDATQAEDLSTADREESGQPIGLALAAAKAEYLGSLPSVTPYDEKSSIEFTMYGMPQYRLECTTHDPSMSGTQTRVLAAPRAASLQLMADTADTPATFADAIVSLNVLDSDGEAIAGSPFSVHLAEATDDPSGRYIKVAPDGTTVNVSDVGYLAVPDTPKQPLDVIPLGDQTANPVKSAIVTNGTYLEITGFDPAIVSVANPWVVEPDEYTYAPDGWWPEPQVKVRSVGGQQWLDVALGQFLATSAPGDPVTGTERVWTSMTVRLTRGTLADNVPPTVRSVTLTNDGTHWTATVDADDGDGTGIVSIVASQVGTPNTASKTFTAPTTETNGFYVLDLDDLLAGVTSENVEVALAITDGAGNTTPATGKGVLFTGPPTGTATLNGGAPATYSRIVSLDSDVLHATEMRVMVDTDPWSDWQPYAASIPVTLTGALGVQTVYAEYRNDSNTQGLGPISSEIEFQQITIDSPPDGSTLTDNTPILDYAVSSAASVGVKVDDGQPQAIPTGAQLGPLTDGPHTVEILANHALGASGSLLSHFTVDATPPPMTISSPASGSIQGTATPTLVFDLSDYSPIKVEVLRSSVSVYLDGSTIPAGGVELLGGNLPFLLDGPHTVTVTGQDVAGNVGSYTQSFTVQTAGPTAAITWPDPDTFTRDSTPVLVFTTTNAESTEVQLNGVPIPDASSGDSLGPLTDGLYTVTVIATDAIGGTATATSIFTVDTTSPVTTDNAPLGWQGTSYTLHFTGSDGGSGMSGGYAKTEYSTDDGATWNPGASVELSGDGTHIVWYRSTDAAGNTETAKSATVKIGTPPEGAVTFLSTGGRVGGASKLGDYVYLAEQSDLCIVDVSDPTTPTIASRLPVPSGVTACGIDIVGSYAYIAGGPGGLWIVDVSQPTHPTSVSRVPTANATSVAVYGGYAYVSDKSNGLVIIAVSNPNSPTITKVVSQGLETPMDVVVPKADSALNWGWAFIADMGGGLKTAWVDVPFNARVQGVGIMAGGDQQAYSVCLDSSGGNAYVASSTGDASSGLYTFDVTTPDGPQPQTAYYGLSTSDRVSRVGSELFVSEGSALGVFDLNYNASVPQLVTTYPVPGPGDVTGSGNYLFVPSDDDLGLWVLTKPADTIAPTAVSSLWSTSHPDALKWYPDANPVFSWSEAQDVGSGVAGYSYRIDQVPGMTPDATSDGAATTASYTGLADGTWYFNVRAVDNAGNAGATTQFTINIDTSPQTGFAPQLSSTNDGADLLGVSFGDFDRDGKQDLITTNGASNTVGVRLGNGDGTFQGATLYDAFGLSVAEPATVADVDGDNKLDVLVPNFAGNKVTVMLGDGNGAFTLKSSPATVSNNPIDIGVGDFNSDGKLDMVVATIGSSSNGNTVDVLMGNGDGTFQPAFAVTTNYLPGQVVIGDFNGDGRQDFAAVCLTTGISVVLGNGNGTFETAVDYSVGGSLRSLKAADVNGDGRQDLITCNYNTAGTVEILLGNVDGTFQAATGYATGANPDDVVVVDVNLDGKQDLVTANRGANTISLLLGNGDGTFAADSDYAVGSGPVELDSADLNGDGLNDVGVANITDKSFSVLLNATPPLGSLQFAAKADYITGNHPQGIVVGDLNADGQQDVAVAVMGSYAGWLAGSVEGILSAVNWLGGDIGPTSVAIADLNGDGKQDVAAGGSGGLGTGVSRWLNSGVGTFGGRATYGGHAERSIAIADLNRDGKLDVVAASDLANTVSVRLGDGSGAFPSYVDYSPGAASTPYSVAVADLNRDGKLDVVTANVVTDNVSVLLGDGEGAVAAAVGYSAGTLSAPYSIAVADLNSDGKLDVITANSGNDSVSVLLGDGAGALAAPETYGSGASSIPHSVAIGDLNRDGKLDVVTANSGIDNVSVLLGDGVGGLAAPVDYSTGTGSSPDSVAVADLNRDGEPDVVTANYNGTVSVLLNTSSR